MRLLVIIATVLLIPAYAVILEWCYEYQQKPKIEQQCFQWLNEAELGSVSMSLNHFDATLTGICQDPDGRDKAEKIVERLRGIRVKDGDNRVQTPAKIVAKFEKQNIQLSGWVDSDQTKRNLQSVAKQFRPDLAPTVEGIKVSPHIVMGPPVTMAVGTVPESISSFLESIRAPSSLSVTPEGKLLRVRGYLPSIDLRARVVAALRGKPGQWELEASNLHASEHVSPAPFTKGDALPAFLKSFYDTPSPGTFSVDVRKGPQMKAFATPDVVSQWLALLLPVSGSARVPLDGITYLPSIYHYPDYKPESQLAPGVEAEPLKALLKARQIYFPSGSSTVEPSEQVKLGPLVFAINSAGPGAKFVVAGYADVGGETATYKGVIKNLRATAVKKMLVRLGAAADGLEIEQLDAARPGEVITEEARHDSRRVELLLK